MKKMCTVKGISENSENVVNNPEDIEPEILYEFLTYAEWPQEPELMVKGYSSGDESSNKKAAAFAKTAIWSIFSSLTGYIPAEISRIINNHLSWQFAVGGNGKVVAILQENCIEIRSFKDDYSTIVGKCYVAKDALPQWRRLAWSPDCSMLALSYSNGHVDCFDALGSKLFTIEALSTATNDLSDALVAILFVDSRVQKTQWFFEIILINFKGVLRSCFVSPTDGFQDYHSFSLSKYFSQGVTSTVYNPKFNTIICSGSVNSCSPRNENQPYLANQFGIVTWRLLSDFPYYKITQSLEEEKLTHKKSSANLLRMPSFILYRNEKPDTVFKVCLSLENTALVAIHVSGALSLWDIPSLRLRKIWPLNEQPDYNAENPSHSFPGRKKKPHITHNPLKHHLVDVNWWSEKAIILARYSGSVAVSSVNNLNNLLGNSLEWFESQPLVSASYDKGFLILECESLISKKRRSVSPDLFDDEAIIEDVVESSDDENDSTVIQKTATFVKTALYYITDSEKFQPPRKKPKIVNKTFRLICLKSTTPEELFARKLDNEVYGEAIELAKAYGLDCDLVYQRQWRNAKVSLATIQDYLSKITKRSWVLHECLERTSEDIESTRALLNYGLQGTDLETLINIGNGADDGIFTVSDPQSTYDDLDSPDDVSLKTTKEVNERKAHAGLLAQVDFSKLTVEQQNLCLIRQKLLKYIDRLATYEVMLGGPMIADEYFDCKFFNKFRAQPAIEATLDFAHENNWQFVAAMFTYHGDEVLSHRLPILSNFPETTSPFEYRSLLPECGFDKRQIVYPWDQEILREQDWVESEACRKVINRNWTASPTYLYECGSELEKYRGTNITPTLLTTWYIERAAEIERCSRLVNNSLELINLGMERNVQGLEKMRDDLLTMEVLVYECYVDESITLDCFQAMKDSEKIHLLMSTSSEETYVKNIRRWLIPFLSRCEKYSPESWKGLMREYLLSLAKYDLSLCVKIFQNSRVEQEHPILTPASELMSLALDCIYACQEDTQLNNAFTILECLPQSGYGPQTAEMKELHVKLDELEKHLGAAEILEKHGINKTVAYIKNCQQDTNEVKQLLTLLTRVVSRKDPPPDEPQWKQLLEDVLELQSDAFQCINKSKCAEIFAESLLCSGKTENISLASGLFVCCAKTYYSSNKSSSLTLALPVEHGIPDDRASHLVIAAAKEYFNSSSNLKDPAMEHAKRCLKLIPVPDEAILAELDLIDSLSILNSFEVDILPLQVRMCQNRLTLIEQIFKTKPDAYRESQKLMTLARFLRVGQDVREWEEGIYILIASAALQARDFHACYNACESLISHKYSKGWEICLALGRCELFKDIKAKQYLLAFAEIHCSDDILGEIIETMHILDSQILHQRLETHFEMAQAQRAAPVEEKEQLKQNENVLGKTTFTSNLHQFTTEATKQVLTTVGNAEFWKSTTSWISPHWRAEKAKDPDTIFNNDFNKLAIPEFFASLMPHTLPSPLMPSYNSYAVPQETDSSLYVCLILFQLAIYEGRWEKNDFLRTVLHQASVTLLPVDSVLGLVYLLALDEPMLIDNCIQQLPNSDTCLHLVIYCCALQICQSAELVKKEALYTSNPTSIVKKAVRYAQTRSTTCDKVLRKYCDMLQTYERRRADFAQGRLLQSLGRGVDVARFSVDDQYKQETVLGLVMTTDEKTYKTAIGLARKYNVPLWEVYMSHLEYLFSEEETGTPSIERRVVDLDLLSVLMKDLPKFKERLTNTIYATISGQDHERLLYYFSILSQCAPKDKDYQYHITLLRKFKPVAQGLDYKAMISGKHDVLKLISPLLTVSNIQIFSKLSTQISKCCKQPLDASMIYRMWLLKLFFEGAKTNAIPSSHQEWISRYNLCKDYFDKLNPSDLMAFIEGALFVDLALDEMTETTRKELLNRTLKFAKLEMGKCKEDSNQRISWQKTLEYLEKALKHLEWMQCDHINELRQVDDGHLKRFLRALELSLSHPDKVKSLLFECVMDGHPFDLLQRLISICPPETSLPPGDVIMETVTLISAKLRNEAGAYNELFQNRDCIQMLNTLIDGIINHNSHGGDLVDLNDIAGELQQLCTDSSIEIPVKLSILSLLEKIYPEDSEELDNLSACKVGAFLASGWPSLQIMQEDIENDEMKEQLFNKLLALCDNLERANTLTKLLICWSTLPSKYNNNYEENSWCKIISLMLQMEDENRLDSVVDVVRITEAKSKLSLQCLEPALMEVMKHGSWQHSLKFTLLTTYDKLYSIMIEATAKLDKDYIMDVDDEVCSLLIQKKLTSRTVSTVLYKPLLKYILNHLQFGAVKEIAADLKENGYYCEAASLLCTGPTSLRTFDAAVGLLKRWL